MVCESLPGISTALEGSATSQRDSAQGEGVWVARRPRSVGCFDPAAMDAECEGGPPPVDRHLTFRSGGSRPRRFSWKTDRPSPLLELSSKLCDEGPSAGVTELAVYCTSQFARIRCEFAKGPGDGAG